MLAGGHGAVVLLGPPFLHLLYFDLGVPLEQGGELLCLYLSASVGSVDLVVLPRAVHTSDGLECNLQCLVTKLCVQVVLGEIPGLRGSPVTVS